MREFEIERKSRTIRKSRFSRRRAKRIARRKTASRTARLSEKAETSGKNGIARAAGARACAICGPGAAAAAAAYDLGDYRVLRCPECGLHFVDLPYDEREIKDMDYYWGEDIYAEEGESIRRWSAGEMCGVERFMPPGRLLDVGCSFGYLLEAAKSRGWQVSGVEISRKIVENYLGGRAGELNVFNGRLEDARYESGSFDAVTMFDVIEHLADPAATLSEVSRVLRPGGLLAVETPREESLFKKAAYLSYALTGGRKTSLIRSTYNPHPGGHRFGFTRRALLKLLGLKGFDPVRVEKRMMPLRMFVRASMRRQGSAFVKLGYTAISVLLWTASAALGMRNRMVVYCVKRCEVP